MNETITPFKSACLQNERPIWVREPRASTAGHLTLFLDAELYRDRVRAADVIDRLSSADETADSWFVFVSMHSPEARWRECPCYPPFAQFIAEELLPWLLRQYPAIANVRQRTLIGLSYTGLAAAFVAGEYPGLFDKVISQSGSFWSNDCWLIQEYKRRQQRFSTDFYLDVGKGETQENVRHREDVLQVVSQLKAVRSFRDVLLGLGYSVKYHEFDGGHSFDQWNKTLPDALRWALPPGPDPVGNDRCIQNSPSCAP